MSAPLRQRPLPARRRRVPIRVLQMQFNRTFTAGLMAERKGLGPEANPEERGTDASHAWAAGWYASRNGRDES